MATSTIYSKIQTKFAAAFTGALANAVVNFKIFRRTVSDGSYDVATSEFTEDTKVFLPTTLAGVVKTDGSCRGVLTDEKVDSEESNVQFNYKIQSLLVLDSELNSVVFDLDNEKYFVDLSTSNIFTVRPNSTAIALEDKYLEAEEDLYYNCVLAGTSDASAPTVNPNKPGDSVVSLITTDFSGWTQAGDGSVTDNDDYWTLDDTDIDSNDARWRRDITVLDDSLQYTAIWEIQKPTTDQATSRFELNLLNGSSTKLGTIAITWATETIGSDPDLDGHWLVPHPTITDRFYLILQITNNSTGNNRLQSQITPAHVVNEIGSFDIYGYSVVKAAHPIPPTVDFSSFTIADWSELFTMEDDGVVWNGGASGFATYEIFKAPKDPAGATFELKLKEVQD